MVYKQSDDSEIVVPEGNEITVVSGDLNTVGSEICIGKECFYLMKNDGYSVTMLAKYNLYVGGSFDGTTWTAYSEEATGIQEATAIGAWLDGEDTIYPWEGIVAFSSTNYWWNTSKNEFKSSYKNSGSNPYVYDSNSNLYKYVENYKEYLLKLGATVIESRLIKYEELVSLGCKNDDFSCTNTFEWVYSTSYWVGSVRDSKYTYRVLSMGQFGVRDYNRDDRAGVRPVISIAISDF